MGKFALWFKQLSKAGRVGVVLALLFGVGMVGAAASPNHPTPATPTAPAVKSATTNANSDATTSISTPSPVVVTQNVTTTEAIPFDSKTVNDPTLDKGVTRVTTEGVDGVKTQTWAVTTTDGTETSRTLVSETVTTQPVTKVTSVGAKVAISCPNGTYVNTAGNTVCRPYETDSAPAGATAQCRDGSYSFSQSRSGTCSHHGGVARWL